METVRPRPPGPPPAAVLSGGHRAAAVLLALLLAGPLPALLPPPALAQDGAKADGGKKEGAKKKDGDRADPPRKEPMKEAGKEPAEKAPEKTGEEILLEALAASWRKGDAAALGARFPEKRRVTLRLPGSEAGDYRAGQAASVLAEYFKDRAFTKVERKSVKETAGTFALEYVRASDRRTVKAELLLVVGTEGETRVLVSARECP
jgi:hypothetical protein